MATWQSELKKDLESVIKGHEEAAKFVPEVKKFATTLDTPDLKADDVAKQLIDFKLGFFASQLLNGQYDAKAEFENNTAKTEAPILDNEIDEGQNGTDEGQPILTAEAAGATASVTGNSTSSDGSRDGSTTNAAAVAKGGDTKTQDVTAARTAPANTK